MLKPINKHTVLKILRDKGTWQGWIAPSNVNHAHIVGGWHLGCKVDLVYHEGEYFNRWQENIQTLKQILYQMAYYNCNSELGRRIRFWEDIKPSYIKEPVNDNSAST